jgi:hypothetical protein
MIGGQAQAHAAAYAATSQAAHVHLIPGGARPDYRDDEDVSPASGASATHQLLARQKRGTEGMMDVLVLPDPRLLGEPENPDTRGDG